MLRVLFQKSLLLVRSKVIPNVLNLQLVRSGHAVSYRNPPPPHSKATTIGADVVSTAMWWWVFWHLWHEYEHVTGEFPYPNPKSWTNKELGIPPDRGDCN